MENCCCGSCVSMRSVCERYGGEIDLRYICLGYEYKCSSKYKGVNMKDCKNGVNSEISGDDFNMFEMLKYGGDVYRVKIMQKVHRVVMRREIGSGDSSMGRYYERKMEIYLNDDMPLEQKQETLLHEVIHSLSEGMGVGLKEEQVRALSAGLYCVLKENKVIE